MKDDNCIFCKIADGEIPSATLYEDEDFKVILDVMPASKGHALILPKYHAKDIYDLPDEVAAKVLVLAKKIMAKLAPILECDGYNIIQNNGLVAGQTVFHFHLHMIPRYKSDGLSLAWKPGELSDRERKEIMKKWNEEV